MKNLALSNISQNSLEELQDLICRVDTLVHHDFLHVTDFVSHSLLHEIASFKEAVNEEVLLRESLF